MQIELFNFAKKPNSTAQPSSAGDMLECLMKTSSSIQFPIVELKLAPGAYPAWNYAHIPDLGRYYFITNATYVRGVWEISLTVDVLASFKSDIGGTSMYMLRSSAQKTGTLADTLWEVTNASTTSTVTVKNTQAFSAGSIIINVVNGDSNSGSTSYVMNLTNFGLFLDCIMVDADKDNVKQAQDASVDVTHYQPIRYINSAYWFPGSVSHYHYTSAPQIHQLKLGNFMATGFTCYQVFYDVATSNPLTYSVTLPKHPQAASRGSFCNGAPYSEYMLNLGPFGGLPLDGAALANAASISISVYEDLANGQGRAIVTTAGGVMLANVTTQWGVPLPVFSGGYWDWSGNVSRNAGLWTAALGAGMMVAGGIGARNAASSPESASATSSMMVSGGSMVLSGFEAAVKGAGAARSGAISSTGSQGGVADHLVKWELYATFYTIADDNNANAGRPLCKVYTPAALTGFMMAQKGLVTSSSASKTEIDAVNAKMTGGFYYE